MVFQMERRTSRGARNCGYIHIELLYYRISGNFYGRKRMCLKSMRDYIFANSSTREIKITVTFNNGIILMIYFNNANVITRAKRETSEDGG